MNILWDSEAGIQPYIIGKTSESLRHKAIGPVKWQPVANIKRHLVSLKIIMNNKDVGVEVFPNSVLLSGINQLYLNQS